MQEEINTNQEELRKNIISGIKIDFDKVTNNHNEKLQKYFDEKWNIIDIELSKITAEL